MITRLTLAVFSKKSLLKINTHLLQVNNTYLLASSPASPALSWLSLVTSLLLYVHSLLLGLLISNLSLSSLSTVRNDLSTRQIRPCHLSDRNRIQSVVPRTVVKFSTWLPRPLYLPTELSLAPSPLTMHILVSPSCELAARHHSVSRMLFCAFPYLCSFGLMVLYSCPGFCSDFPFPFELAQIAHLRLKLSLI